MGPKKHSNKLRVYPGPEDVYREATRYVLDTLAAGGPGPAHWMLSGGSTPESLYRKISTHIDAFEASEIHVYWGDERAVAPTEPSSNYGMARRSLLEHVPIEPACIHRIRGEDDPHRAAADYERCIVETISPRASQVPQVDLLLLGIGADGHTASLFPGSHALRERERLFVPTLAPDGSPRITATLRLINAARNVMLLAVGSGKASAVARAVRGDPGYDCPASLIAPRSGSIAWFLDAGAASEVNREALEADHSHQT